MFKKVLAGACAIALLAAMWLMPVSAEDPTVNGAGSVFTLDYRSEAGGGKDLSGKTESFPNTDSRFTNFQQSLTLETYAKISDLSTNTTGVVMAGTWSGAAGVALWYNRGTLYFTVSSASGNAHASCDVKDGRFDNQWIHLLGVYSSDGSVVLYINGVASASATMPANWIYTGGAESFNFNMMNGNAAFDKSVFLLSAWLDCISFL